MSLLGTEKEHDEQGGWVGGGGGGAHTCRNGLAKIDQEDRQSLRPFESMIPPKVDVRHNSSNMRGELHHTSHFTPHYTTLYHAHTYTHTYTSATNTSQKTRTLCFCSTRSSKKYHEIRLTRPRRPNLLAVYDVPTRIVRMRECTFVSVSVSE